MLVKAFCVIVFVCCLPGVVVIVLGVVVIFRQVRVERYLCLNDCFQRVWQAKRGRVQLKVDTNGDELSTVLQLDRRTSLTVVAVEVAVNQEGDSGMIHVLDNDSSSNGVVDRLVLEVVQMGVGLTGVGQRVR